MFRKRTSRRRKAFLIDSNLNRKKKPKKLRNRSLNFLAKVLFINQLLKLFKASFFFAFLFFCMTGFILFSVFSPYFNLQKISILRDNPNIDVEKIETALVDFYDQNLLFISKEEIKKTLFTNFLEFREIEIIEKWPSELKIKIKISEPFFNLFNVETANFSVISEDGVILAEKPQEDLTVLKIQEYEKILSSGQRFVEREVLQKIKIANDLMQNQIKIPIKDILFFPVAREIHLISQKETAFWVDLQISIDSQIKKLELATNEIGLFSKKIDHVDLRIPNQIFWK